MRKAKIDSNSARLFLRKAVGINSGERLDQRALAMIHVTCGSNDEMFWLCHRKPVQMTAIHCTLFASDHGFERSNNFRLLVREHGSQVELKLASFNVPDNGRRVRTQPCGQFLRLESNVSYVERRGLHRRTRQRAATDLGASSANCCFKR